jgi:hypothetical protein
VWAIGQGIAWEPSYLSPEVVAGLADSVASELAVIDIAVAPGDPDARMRGPELVVVEPIELVDDDVFGVLGHRCSLTHSLPWCRC